MAAAAPILLETVVLRVLAALGVGAMGEAAREAVKKHNDDADKARSTPIARAETQTKAKEKCKECPPDKGVPFLRNTAGWSDDSITYQMRIGQMPRAPAGYLTEWEFGGVKFDGFDPGQCLLKEAKARYDQFFDEWGRFAYRFQGDIFAKMTAEAVSQNNAAMPKPPIQLQWCFMEPVSYRYMSKVLLRATPDIEILYRP